MAPSDPSTAAASSEPSAFEAALQRYNTGASAAELVDEFAALAQQNPRQSACWTCLAWLQLLNNQPLEGLRSARLAVRLSPQDPQARINLTLAMLETGAKGVREHIEVVQRVLLMAPEMESEINDAIADGLQRRPDWQALQKVSGWLQN
jgi:predicted Zn-dependent protease